MNNRITFSNGKASIMNLEEYYKNPIMESWIYVSGGLKNLKNSDPEMYEAISKKQAMLSFEIEERIEDICKTSERLGFDCSMVKSYVEEFLQKFPLALRKQVVWDDVNFIFLYILTKLLKPKLIIEAGCNVGFSSTFFALAIKENGNGCKFYTMDPYPEYLWESMSFIEHSKARNQKINYENLNVKCGPLSIVPSDLKEFIIFKSGRSEDILPTLLKNNKEIDIFFHDSDHSYRNMVWECRSVLSSLKTGGYILVHDIGLNSAFRELFSKDGGLVIKDNIGIFKNTSKQYIKQTRWSSTLNNSRVNDEEYQSEKIRLNSSPKEIVFQMTNSCGLNCIFCAEQEVKTGYDFDNFYQGLEGKVARYICQAERISFRSCGGMFQTRELERMLHWRINCLEVSFPEIEKDYYTNGLDLTPEVCDFIVHPGGILSIRYIVKNTINIFLCASNSRLYKTLTGSDSFYKVLDQLQYLVKLRKESNDIRVYLKINLIFVVTTLNIENLPDFVKLASNLGVDKVICCYVYIYKSTQDYLSCFFKQEQTNRVLNRAEELAEKLNIEIDIPPKFGQREYLKLGLCRKAWSQIKIDAKGNVLTCDHFGKTIGSLWENDFIDIWNGDYYQDLRHSLIEKNSSCFGNCIWANPQSVNNLLSHVINNCCKTKDRDLIKK